MASVHRLPVSLMSPENAERKRAQDRVNQRYSRARRKSKVEELEHVNKTLLQKLAIAEAEIARLRDRESAVRKVLGDATASASSQHAHVQSPVQSRMELEENVGEIRTNLPSPASTIAVTSPPTVQSVPLDAAQQSQGPITDLPFCCPIQEFPTEYFDFTFANDSNFNLIASASTDHEQLNASDAIQAPHWDTVYDLVPQLNPYALEQSTNTAATLADWQSLPLHLSATTVLDEVVLKTTESGRQWRRRHAGRQHSELSQPSFPSISSLLNPHSEDDANNPIATAVSAQIRRTNVTSFTGRVAFHYIVAVMLRWYVAPSEETYAQLPDNMRPTDLQRTVPHSPWIDLFCWPEGRDAIIKHMAPSQFDEFRLLTSTTICVHWPYSDADVFLSSSDGKQVILNPVFVSHIRDSRVSLSCRA